MRLVLAQRMAHPAGACPGQDVTSNVPLCRIAPIAALSIVSAASLVKLGLQTIAEDCSIFLITSPDCSLFNSPPNPLFPKAGLEFLATALRMYVKFNNNKSRIYNYS